MQEAKSDTYMEDAQGVNSEPKRFKRADKFIGCNEALETMFVPAEGYLYRVVHSPLQQNDELVQSEQMFEGLAPSMPGLLDTIAPDSSVEEQFDHVANWALSFNIDDSLLADSFWSGYDLRKTETQKQNYLTRKGTVVARYLMTPLAGVMQSQPDDNGHVVVAEYEDFVLEEYRVKEFGFKPLTDYRHEEEQ